MANFKIEHLTTGALVSEDLLGDNTEKAQALANEIAQRDYKRNNGQESIETGDLTDMFSMARFQIDLVDVCNQSAKEEAQP